MAASARLALPERPDWYCTAWRRKVRARSMCARYVPARKGVTEGGVGGNKIPLGLGEAPSATRGPIGFLLEREEGFLGKIIYVAPHRFPP